MLARTCLVIVLLACTSAWSQMGASNSEATTEQSVDVPLQVPPPVSGEAYSSEFAGDTRSNYLRGGVTFTSTYSNNVSVPGGPGNVSEMSYSIFPTVALDKTTPQLHLVLNYSPGFTFYQRTSSNNQSNQNLGVNFQYRLSPNLTVTLQEGFHKTSNIFSQPNPLAATTVSGSVPNQGAGIIAPFADQISDDSSVQVTYQLGADSMLGGGATYSASYYPNSTQVTGLYDSHAVGGSVFYSRRLGEKYFLGTTYQYQNALSYQAGASSTQTQTQTIFVFLTVYLKPTLSVSFSAGPQHYNATQGAFPAAASWSPLTMASVNWQGGHTTLAASYARIVTGGGGLSGAFHSNSASASAMWQLSRTWSAGVSGSYATSKTLTPLFVMSSPGGHTISGSASLQHSFRDNISAQFGYSWLHQSYTGISSISENPNVNSAFVSVSYQFTKALQR